MKEFFTNTAVFVVFCIAFSGLSACSGEGANEGSVANKKPPVVNAAPGDKKASDYPPVPAGLADAEFELLDGTKFTVASRKGKVMMLNIWGTWCGPCRAEMPHLVEMQDQYRDKGFEVIGLNIGDNNGGQESVELITKFAGDMKLNYTLARSKDLSTKQFYMVTKQQVVPQSILVDKDGRIRGVFVGGGQRIFDSMKETVAKVISETAPAS